MVAACGLAKLSQSELARELGISNGFLSDCLREQRLFPQDRWVKLTRALPTMTLEQVADLALQTWPLKIDMMQSSTEDRAPVAMAVAKVVRKAAATTARRR